MYIIQIKKLIGEDTGYLYTENSYTFSSVVSQKEPGKKKSPCMPPPVSKMVLSSFRLIEHIWFK